ncbi:hypothetical protein AGMMS50256_16840 [Betaproteobacteria bacterium]|nr:hypothetical protein AGMMS50256_16840 [Betaproteobacteria bacterium]
MWQPRKRARSVLRARGRRADVFMLELSEGIEENGMERRGTGWNRRIKKGLVFEQRQGPEFGGKETIKAAQGAAFI